MPALMGKPHGVHRYVGGAARAKAKAYRHTDAGRLARKMYLHYGRGGEVPVLMTMRRAIKRRMKAGR